MVVVSLAALLLWPAALLRGQSGAGETRTTKPGTGRNGARRAERAAAGAPDPLAEARRATAISLISSLADEARGFRDETLRARVQAQAADTLWEIERERALALFLRAWDAAGQFDQEMARRAGNESEAERSMKRRTAIFGGVWNLRGEIITMIARRDRALGEKLLAELQSEAAARQAARNEASAKPAANSLYNDSLYTDEEHSQRLALARRLLDDGDVSNALQIADPGLHRLNAQTILFLTALRARDTRAADARFATLLTLSAGDPTMDANHVSLLSSYAFTPGTFISVNRTGAVSTSSQDDGASPHDLAPALRVEFFRTAAQILLRPLAPPDEDRSTSGPAGTYFIITRLLPLFEQHAPSVLPQLRARLAALAPDTPERIRDGRDARLTQGMNTGAPAFDSLQDALDQASRATDARARDQAYASAAIAAVAKGGAGGRAYAEKINDGDLRRRMLAYLDFAEAREAVKRREVAEVARLAHAGDLTPVQRVWAFTEAARLLEGTDPARLIGLLGEAENAARRLDAADPNRASALVTIAARLFTIDPARAWETMGEAVRAANGADKFDGGGGRIDFTLRTPGQVIGGGVSLADSDLPRIFATLARADFERAVTLARSFNGEAPRAAATLAIAGATLKDKSKPKA